MALLSAPERTLFEQAARGDVGSPESSCFSVIEMSSCLSSSICFEISIKRRSVKLRNPIKASDKNFRVAWRRRHSDQLWCDQTFRFQLQPNLRSSQPCSTSSLMRSSTDISSERYCLCCPRLRLISRPNISPSVSTGELKAPVWRPQH